jgi:hypothetical protein
MKKRIDCNGQTRVRDWYAGAFPTDEWAIDGMNRIVTFQDVYECLCCRYNVYSVLGVSDSIVRERVFDKLATLMGCNYDYVYYQWLKTERPLGMQLVGDMNGLKFN